MHTVSINQIGDILHFKVSRNYLIRRQSEKYIKITTSLLKRLNGVCKIALGKKSRWKAAPRKLLFSRKIAT